ncbi:arylamine N-acetyltransferase [Streptacidiphilus sp. P02-A3a]|uniref:arylamine N-acetyltransferase family protein n=1 Tax=Streptacidiphilus sp. P02-A3a TaxID=2704468 RepID=UPI0015FBD9AE|nr:arylamine N-acetyltransferase [Streptacidiphilus sp. P02-A3a]QMU71221.1 arylamine N-acetyltransferase [Streptacidiphilus sp. P02-A3a]
MTSKTNDHPAWTAPYLARLGVDDPRSLGAPSLDTLRRLHRAHVELVAFENFDIQLGRPQSIDPAESIARILAGRGGYCFNLNNAFYELLTVLGYDVTVHRGQINGSAATAKASADAYVTHMALTVVIDGERWSVDVGLANSHHEPIPLREGVHVQGPFRFELRPLPEIGPDAWRFFTDPAQTTFHSMDFTLAPATWEDFRSYHTDLSTSPQSPYVRWFELFRRDAGCAEFVLDDEFTRDEGAGRRTTRILESAEELFTIATDVFHLDLSAIDDADRAALWDRVQRAGAEWRAKQQSAEGHDVISVG